MKTLSAFFCLLLVLSGCAGFQNLRIHPEVRRYYEYCFAMYKGAEPPNQEVTEPNFQKPEVVLPGLVWFKSKTALWPPIDHGYYTGDELHFDTLTEAKVRVEILKEPYRIVRKSCGEIPRFRRQLNFVL